MENQTPRYEEAAPSFPTWKRRLEEAEKNGQRGEEVERFLQVLKAVGSPMIDEDAVHFVHYAPDARRVALTGELTQWGQTGMPLSPLGATGFFYLTVDVQGPARVEYKFIVDGEWVSDPFCPNAVDNGVGEQNSYFIIGDLRDPPELEQVSDIPHGEVEEFDFQSAIMHNTRRVYVYLPPNYEQAKTTRYPTMYVHDGGEYLTRARLATVLDNLIQAGEVPPLMAVMMNPGERIREYWANDDYARFLEQEMIPHIDSHYRTIDHRDGRGTMGASMGGLMSTYLGLAYSHLFSKIGGQSSALFLLHSDQATDLRRRFAIPRSQRVEAKLLPDLVSKLRAKVAFYFDVGKYEPQFIPAHHQLVPLLEAKGCPCLFQELVGGHNWTNWRAHLKDLLTFLWRDSLPLADEPPPARDSLPSPQKTDRPTVVEPSAAQDGPAAALQQQGWSPYVERAVEDGQLRYRLALPACDPQDIGLFVVSNQLIVQLALPDPGNGSGQTRRFEQVVPLPDGVKSTGIQARYASGVLEVVLLLSKRISARRVPIQGA